MQYPRAARVAELIHAELSSLLLKEVKDPRVKNVVITRVEVSRDMRLATAHFSRYGEGRGSEEEIAEGLIGLDRAVGFLRAKLGERLELRVVPNLRFLVDRGVAYSDEIERLLAGIRKRERRKKEAR
ncbi:MAG: ribosome-binding factor A [Candidatus Tectomicrobia bacterium RIFCSPLOWO2_12_FULL_69_37]|nr:MAG: ribosome-binding factor A [Candidatus Tectomicrobia bacterium RIFCSPLOWO2_02_FULL_70_19]OGL67354.1 MAG: ribosome-binding factor A [Candidatus Tectomicrobia bacterium RIFCSPLOWO2_12_FULL_69_37]